MSTLIRGWGPRLTEAAFNGCDKLGRADRLHPDFVPCRFLGRHLQRVATQDGSLRTEVGGSISDFDTVAIGESPIRHDKFVPPLSKVMIGLSYVDGEIDDVSGTAQNEHQQLGYVFIVL